MADVGAFEQQPARRAILFADLVESVRLYQQQEARTIARWNRFAEQVRTRIAPQGQGRLVRVVGDGLLLDFAGASEATRTAFELHRGIAALNEPGDTEGSFALRVGLHVAEVVEGHDNIFGAGVNLAQRLCAMAQPGGTACSAAFRAELGDGVQADIRDMGERVVKNLVEPVRAFALQPPGERPAVHLPSTEDLRPAVAVVPFVAMPADPEHDALGHAMADDIIASLSRHPGLRVLSRASTAVLRGQDLPLPRVRELLGASFLLTGRFYVRNGRVRLAAELAELREGQVLWTGGVGGTVDALFEGQDELVPHLVAQVSQQVLAHELARVRSLPMDSLAAYSLLLGARGLLHSLVPKDFQQSREIVEHLIERHPRQPVPEALLSEWHIVLVSQGASPRPTADVDSAFGCAQRALDKDPNHPEALIAAGVAHSFRHGDYAQAAQLYERALQQDPHNPRALARRSESHSEAGEHALALERATQAIALSPMDPERPFFECAAARAAYMMERWDLAAEHARASLRLNVLHGPSHRNLIAALWQAGQHQAARDAAAAYMRLMPTAGVGAPRSASRDELLRSPFVRVLVAAGVPL